jgi:hypothetical protein
MTRKKKPKPFHVVTEIKAMAREQIGMPPGEKVLPNKKRRKAEKHKSTLSELLRQQ